MGLIQRTGEYLAKKFLAPVINKEVSKRFTAAVNREKEDASWRRITDVERKRDLSPMKHDKMIRVADYLNDRNPIAKKIVRLTADYVMGEGMKIKADEVEGREEEQKELQKIIDKFWKVNEWDLKQFQRIEELGLYGEQIYRTFINEYDGTVKLGMFDPEMINKVLTNPENAEDLTYIVPKGVGVPEDCYFDIIRPQRFISIDAVSGRKVPIGPERLKGDTFFFNVNRGSFATRGKSDLLAVADWLDIYDRTLYTMTERVTFLLTFIWEVIINGASEPELQKRLKELEMNPPKPGSFQVHNENEKWEPNSPDLKGRDFNDFFQTIKGPITGGSGFPEHWLFGQGEDVNKASAQEMDDPTLRQLLRRQKYVIYMFRQMIDFQIVEKIKKGILSPKLENYPYSIIIPQPSKKDASTLAETFSTMTNGMAIATSNNFLTTETATKTLSMIVSQMGIEVKPEEEGKNMNEARVSKIYEAVQKVVKELQNGKGSGKPKKK